MFWTQIYNCILRPRPCGPFFANLRPPNFVGEITLASSDPFEIPNIDPKYFIHDEKEADLKILIKGIKIDRLIASQELIHSLIKGETDPSAKATSDDEIGDFIRSD